MGRSHDEAQNARGAAGCITLRFYMLRHFVSVASFKLFLINLLYGIMQIMLHVVKLARWAIFKLTLLVCLQAGRNVEQFCEYRNI